MEKQECQIDLERKKRIIFGWKPPPISWLKCEIGSAWDKDRNQSGASWILSNADGKVMLHGRRSFSSINSRLEASFENWSWAIESMKSLHYNSVIFSGEDHDLIKAIVKPSAWPALKFYTSKLMPMFQSFLKWRVSWAARKDLREATQIANSVVSKDLFQSYIAIGFPAWLRHLYV
ncbi:hypothetical protein F2Q69_00007445 [Brassica cretica]|uniref:RNase H type-1 domain-containing protein n=1 Tax=Brassica cretica TaxID=69181 RepID=A0A8S9PBX2_BRACR|nr:hypothetical protein F2Q69_00007445 [Brassica cretica]